MSNYSILRTGSQGLKDKNFDWKGKKVKTLKLSDIYKAAGYPEYSIRAKSCSTWLQFLESSDKDNDDKMVRAGNYCNLRLCPACTSRKAYKMAKRLSHVIKRVEENHNGVQFLFLTISNKNVGFGELSNAITEITKGWYYLLKQRAVERAVKGWFRAIEITYKPSTGFNVHIHAILAVETCYFYPSSGLYITQPDWVQRWAKALRVTYAPTVNIKSTYAKGRPSTKKLAAGAIEAAKYATKDSDYISTKIPFSLAVDVVKEYTIALQKRRLTAYGGWMADYAHEDITCDVDNSIFDLLTEYNWSFGQGDYLLSSCVPVSDLDKQ